MQTEELDPVAIEVIDNRIDEAVREMQYVMFRTGYSTIIRDSKDGSAGICLPDGSVIGQEFRLPLHCGVFPPTVRAIREHYPPAEIDPGDVFLVNDPYLSGANHSSDMIVVKPVFYDGDIQMFCCTIAHKPDVGGLVPGTGSPDARELYHEGLLLPPVKYHEAGEVNTDIENIVRNNSRTPEVTMGDIRGQTGCTIIGDQKLTELFDDYSPDLVRDAARSIISKTRASLADRIRPWDGSANVTGTLDSVPGGDDTITIALEIRSHAGDERLTFDFTGSDPQSDGPANMQPHVVKSACMLGTVGMIDSSLALNAGIGELCEYVLPDDSIVNPTRPAPCNTYSKGMCVTMHCVLRALSQFAPENAVAETSNTAGISVGRQPNTDATSDDAEDVVHYEIMGSGYGGHSDGDGANCMASDYKSNVEFASIEIVETEFPDRVTQFRVLPDSGGAGEHRGGVGFVREYEMHAPMQFTYRGTNHVIAAEGVGDGQSPGTGTAVVNPDASECRTELNTIDTVPVDSGDRVRIERQGGGGFGSPLDRDPDLVLKDVRDGLVTVEKARTTYGVVIADDDGDLRIDHSKTQSLRERMD